MSGRLVVLAGPSCAGKSPLAKALGRLHPELADALEPLVLHNSRAPRPGEEDGEDYHFRSRDEIRRLGERDGFEVRDVRGDLHGVDLRALRERLEETDVLFEGNPEVGLLLLEHEALAGVERASAFLSPVSAAELAALRDATDAPEERVADLMRRKLLRRLRAKHAELGLPHLEDVERRCASAWDELGVAHRFGAVIVNHDGEDSDHWDVLGPPVGDARRATDALAALLRGEADPPGVERWETPRAE